MSEFETKSTAGDEREKICWQCGRTFTTGMEVCPDDGARLIEMAVADREDPLVGTVFDGRFRIYGKLGEGGMGSVYSARRLDFETDVALKLLKADFARDEGIRKRFMYEARVISNLKHPHSVRLFDFGQTADGHVYMVMELLDGESLADRLAYRFVSYREVFDIIPPVCGVLGEAHIRDVIHRDLKPENIYLLQVDGNREFPKLIDFGIAKHNRAETMTQSGTLWGTPAYMSPEQARGDEVGGPADIYGIGVMIYELISGNLPFHASTQMGFAVKHINEEARPLSSIPGLHSVPEELDDFLLSMLAKRPEDRPESMEVVADTLNRIRDEYFDDELLDSIPAEEVDPIALQKWMKEAPDISQNLPGEKVPREVDEFGSTARAEVESEDEEQRQLQETTLGPGPIEDQLDAVPERVEPSPLKRALPYVVAAGVVAVIAVMVTIWVVSDNGSAQGNNLAASSVGITDNLPSEPLDRENVVGVATMRAAFVVIEARGLVQEIGEVDGKVLDDDFDFIDGPIGSEDDGRSDPDSSDDDARLRKALEETF